MEKQEVRNTVLVGRPHGWREFGKPKRKWMDNIKRYANINGLRSCELD
jgi:hypothetical protein